MQKLISETRHVIVCLCALFLGTQAIMAQNHPYEVDPISGIIKCGAVQDDEALRAKYPEMGTSAEFEAWLQEKIARLPEQEAQRADPILTIPVVVHLIHQGQNVGTSPNYNSSRVYDQIEVLNQDFRRMMGTPGFNMHPDGADMEVEFCPAYIANDGTQMMEPGINRINVNDVGIHPAPFPRAYINDTIKPFTIWDPEQYFNIWVLIDITATTSGGGVVAGYAQFPSQSGLSGLNANGGPAGSDGIVILASQFGGGSVGRTATHEAGHFFGLRHTSGDPPFVGGVATGGCNLDDFCADTPNSAEQNFGCPPSGLFSCNSNDMIENYMDYTNGSCQNILTNDQKTRVRAVLTNAVRRANLPNSTVCDVPVAAPIAAFTVDSAGGCNGLYQFFDNSSPVATNWIWIFGDGQTFNEKNPTVTFATPGTYTITLIVNNEIGTAPPLGTSITVGFTGSANIGISSNVTIQPGGFAQLTATGGVSYSWVPTTGLNNASVPNPICQPAATTIYTVTANDAFGCVGTASVIVWVEGTIAIDDLLSESALLHPPFPNPVNESVTFSADLETGGDLSLNLLDITGKRLKSIHQNRVGAGAFKTNWQRQSDIPAGIYLVEWNLDGRKSMQKIILN